MHESLDRRSFLQGLLAAASAVPLAGCAHAGTTRRPRVGFMSGAEPVLVAAFHDELRRLGYVDGASIHLESRLARPNTRDNASHAEELASMNLDFIVVAALPQALAIRRLDPTLPMVIITCPGFVSNGFAQSLERPGGIYTGMDELPPGVTARRLQLLTTAVPGIASVALLSTTPGVGGHEAQLADALAAAATLGVSVKAYRAQSPGELEAALEAIRADAMEGLLNFQGGLSLANRETIVRFAERHRIPAIFQSELFVDAGGLMAWAPDQQEQYRKGARYADRIIRGASPGDIPVEYPSAYYLTINTTAAARIGVDFPRSLREQAHRIVS